MRNYTLIVHDVKDKDQSEMLSATLKEMDLIYYVFDDVAYFAGNHEALFDSWEEQSWDSFNGQMIILSEKFSKMVFELTVQTYDRFMKIYYKNGESETCIGEVIYETPKKIKMAANF